MVVSMDIFLWNLMDHGINETFSCQTPETQGCAILTVLGAENFQGAVKILELAF